MRIINSIISIGGDRWRNWNLATSMRLQINVLRFLLRKAKATEQGQRYGYAKLLKLSDEQILSGYVKSVPVQDYEAIRPQVMRMMHGESDVLCQGRCLRYAQSSGTSGGKSKYIPITTDSLHLNHYAGLS